MMQYAYHQDAEPIFTAVCRDMRSDWCMSADGCYVYITHQMCMLGPSSCTSLSVALQLKSRPYIASYLLKKVSCPFRCCCHACLCPRTPFPEHLVCIGQLKCTLAIIVQNMYIRCLSMSFVPTAGKKSGSACFVSSSI